MGVAFAVLLFGSSGITDTKKPSSPSPLPYAFNLKEVGGVGSYLGVHCVDDYQSNAPVARCIIAKTYIRSPESFEPAIDALTKMPPQKQAKELAKLCQQPMPHLPANLAERLKGACAAKDQRVELEIATWFLRTVAAHTCKVTLNASDPIEFKRLDENTWTRTGTDGCSVVNAKILWKDSSGSWNYKDSRLVSPANNASAWCKTVEDKVREWRWDVGSQQLDCQYLD